MNIAYCDHCDPATVIGVNVGLDAPSHSVGGARHQGKVLVVEDAPENRLAHNETVQVYLDRLASKYALLMKDLRGKVSIELTGGLGDVLHSLHHTMKYAGLMSLKPDERRLIVLLSHNPHSRELFEWHPKAKQLDILYLGHVHPFGTAQRATLRLPYPMPDGHRKAEPLTYYPAPSDRPALEELSRLRWIGFFLTGSDNGSRDIPRGNAELAADAAISAGFNVVVFGRTYRTKATHGTCPVDMNHKEPVLRPRPGVISMVDRLSVPGTLQALGTAGAVFCSHSAMCLASWWYRRPTFVSLDETNARMFNQALGYAFGRDFPENRHAKHSEWNVKMFSDWLACINALRHPVGANR